MKGRNSQVARIYTIISLLEAAPHGLTVGDLLSRLEDRGYDVGKRTVYRDLDALRTAGFPLEEKGKSEDAGARWTLERAARINRYLNLSLRELLALYMTRSVLLPLKETPFYEDLIAAFSKIEETLGQKAQSFLDELSEGFHFEPGPAWGLGLDADVVDTVRAGCTERQVLSLRYESANSQTTSDRQVGPHFIYFAKGSLYLVGEDLGDHKIKVFAIPRMSQVVLTEKPYETPATNPEEFFGASFGVFRGHTPTTVRVTFDPQVASFVKERRWHPSQVITEKAKGWIEVALEVSLTPELVQWVLSFGSRAQVLEPRELIDRIQSESKLVEAMYGTRKNAG